MTNQPTKGEPVPQITLVVQTTMVPVPVLPPIGSWPLREEDGTTAVHMHNIGADYEKARRKAITEAALAAYEPDVYPHHPLWVHHAVAAAREERVFYAHVWLTDQDRGLVYAVLYTGPASYREIVQRLNGNMGRRQTRRVLQSLLGGGAATSEIKQVGKKKRRVFTVVQPSDLPIKEQA